jgi:hypothetical protein
MITTLLINNNRSKSTVKTQNSFSSQSPAIRSLQLFRDFSARVALPPVTLKTNKNANEIE